MLNNTVAHPTLATLVGALPEVYQPIFGHPEFADRVKRDCAERLAHIVEIYKVLAAKLGRPLRVLDLGCAQGFFCFSLAQIGAEVHGIDFQDCNVSVCEALRLENPAFNARFELAAIEQTLLRLENDQYDLILGLSVFHHSVHKLGAKTIQKVLSAFADKTSACVFEMALAHEPLYWAPAQPKDVRELMDGFSFVHELDQSKTHLSDVTRPLFFASNRFWFLGGIMEGFAKWKERSHMFANGPSIGSRRYFYGNGVIAKLFLLMDPKTGPQNVKECASEAAFLANPPPNFKTPRMLTEGRSSSEAWLVREYLPGELLIDKFLAGSAYRAEVILKDVLDQLTILEASGLYHTDLRTWNVLIDDDGHAALIDYGAIVKSQRDCVWPNNVFLAFIIFANEVFRRSLENPDPLRLPLLNPERLPEPYRSILWEMLEMPLSEWRFVRIRDRVAQTVIARPASASRSAMALAMDALEVASMAHRGNAIYWRHRAEQSEIFAQKLQKSLNQIGDMLDKPLTDE